MKQVFLATLAGGIVVFVAMVPLTMGPVITIRARDLDMLSFGLALAGWFPLVMSAVSEDASKRLEAVLAALRAAKRSFGLAWRTAHAEECARLEVR